MRDQGDLCSDVDRPKKVAACAPAQSLEEMIASLRIPAAWTAFRFREEIFIRDPQGNLVVLKLETADFTPISMDLAL